MLHVCVCVGCGLRLRSEQQVLLHQALAVKPAAPPVEGLGPRGALRHMQLAARSLEEKKSWMEEARVDAILGACRLSLRSVKSGVCCYVAFASVLCAPWVCASGAHCDGSDVQELGCLVPKGFSHPSSTHCLRGGLGSSPWANGCCMRSVRKVCPLPV